MWFALAFCAVAASQDLLSNPGFEARPTASSPISGWEISLGATNGSKTPESLVVLDPDESTGGRQSLRLSGDADTRGWKILQQEIAVRPGGRYTLSAQVKTRGVEPNGFGLNNCYIGLFFFDAQEKVVEKSLVWPKQPDQDWKELTVRANAPETARKAYVYIFLSMIGDLWIDDLDLEVKGGAKLAELEKIWFEDFDKLRKPPRKWAREIGATNQVADGEGAESVAEIDQDEGALRLAGDANTGRWWALGPELKAKPGELYRFTGKVRAADVRHEGSQFSNLHLSLTFLDRKKNRIGDTRFGQPGAGTFDWREVAVEAVSPEGTRTVRAQLFLSMSGEAWFDELELARLEGVPLPYGNWVTEETDQVTLRYAEDHPKASQMTQYARRLDEVKAYICRALEVEFPEKITVLIYKDNDEGRLLTGANLDFADHVNRKVHQRLESYIGHEMVHVIAHNMLQYSGTTILGEGIAVWLNGQSAERHHQRAAALMKDGELPSVQAMLDKFRSLAQGYPASGSFCGYLIEEYGLALFKELYPLEDPSAHFQERTGKSFVDIEPEWRDLLKKYR